MMLDSMRIFRAGPRVGGGIQLGIQLGMRLGMPYPHDGIGTGRNRDIKSAHCLPGGKIAGPDFMVSANEKGGPDGSPRKPNGFLGHFEMHGKDNLDRRGRPCAST